MDDEGSEMAIGAIELRSGEKLSAGETLETEFTLLLREAVTGRLEPGRRWRLQDALRPHGSGIILEVLSREKMPND